jgi:replication factor C subunit 3/5
MLLSDKYRPTNINQFQHNYHLRDHFKMIISNPTNINNIIFYGLSGTGKYSYIMAMLSQIYDDTVYQLKTYHKTLESKPNTFFYIKKSQYHIEIDLSDYRNNDKAIICEYINSVCKTYSITSDIYRIIIIKNAHTLSKMAQQSLRYITERHMKSTRFFFIAKSLGSIIDPIRSRCLLIRFCIPTNKNIYDILYNISQSENINIDELQINTIIENCKINNQSNLTIAIGLLEEFRLSRNISRCVQPIIIEYNKIIKLITTNKNYITSSTFSNIRKQLYIIYITHNNLTLLIEHIVTFFNKSNKYTNDMKFNIIKNSAEYQHKIITTNKAIIHIEAFIFSVIGIINQI